ncbi:unnamed protein product [Phytophthora fragariaefolia]|uniref:Unnamed protein product n=1 Tax=Phytophthora fragariaefolia TaxID=1490495 RepID=A0A9W7D7Z8_9STRA|nr:unnamed protein product [Phytophthora fragariaefolia]
MQYSQDIVTTPNRDAVAHQITTAVAPPKPAWSRFEDRLSDAKNDRARGREVSRKKSAAVAVLLLEPQTHDTAKWGPVACQPDASSYIPLCHNSNNCRASRNEQQPFSILPSKQLLISLVLPACNP